MRRDCCSLHCLVAKKGGMLLTYARGHAVAGRLGPARNRYARRSRADTYKSPKPPSAVTRGWGKGGSLCKTYKSIVMLEPIQARKVMRRMYEVIDAHNSSCPLVSHERKTADGRTKTVTRRSGIIREQVITTFHQVLSAYIESYNYTASVMPAGMYTVEDPPSLPTNCVRLSDACKATDRTVRNHIALLTKLGLVSTKWHGNRKNFELWITPKILFGAPAPEAAKTAQKPPVSPVDDKNFPHNLTHGENIATEKRKADMCVVDTERTITEREVGQDTGWALPLTTTSSPLATAGTEGSAGPQSRVPRLPEGLSQWHTKLLLQFWFYAWKVLYPNREFDLDEQEKSIRAIHAGVYGCFKDNKTDQEWINLHTYQLEKLDKAARYYDMHPEKYPGDPYGVYAAGKGYFDIANTKGFIGIDAWMKREKVQKVHNKAMYYQELEKRKYNLLRQARTDFWNLNNNKKLRIPVQRLDNIGLFQYYHAVFAGFGREWVDRFCEQWQDQLNKGFRLPKYYKPVNQRRKAGEIPPEIIEVKPWMEGDGQGYYIE